MPIAPRPLAAIAVMLLGITAGAACRRQPVTPPKSALTLRIGTAVPAESSGDVGLAALIDLLSSDALIATGWNGRPDPRLADSWEPLDPGPGFRLHIRKGLRFHDGTPLTAQVVRDLLRTQAVKLAYPGSENIASIDAEGEDVLLHLHEADSFVLSDLNMYAIVDSRNRDNGTGPFKIVSRKPARFTKYADYYRGSPTVDAVELTSYSTQRKAWAALMRGDIDFLHQVSRDAVDFVQAESSIRLYPSLRPFYTAMVFNLHRPALRPRAVRQALSEAVNRQEIIGKGMNGRAQVADGPIWPFHWAYTAAARTYTYNPAAARIRLESEGLAIRPVPNEMPSRMRLTCVYYSEDGGYEPIARVLQKQLFDIGVDVTMEPLSARQMRQRLSLGDFDAFLFELTSGRSLSWVYRFWHSPMKGAQSLIDTGYRSADPILDRIKHASTDQETRAAVADLQEMLYDDPPAIFLAWPEVDRAVDSRFIVPSDNNPDILGKIWQWQLRGPSTSASR